jgi:hypothetical protein
MAKESFGTKVNVHTVYKNSAGKRLPSVTTVLGVLAKPALIPWANRLGLQGIDSSKFVDETASIGTLAHAMVLADLGGEEPDLNAYTPDQIERAEHSMGTYRQWREGKTIQAHMIEVPIVSERLGYGGTVDLYATVNARRTLVDVKTSKAIYPEHKYQVSAYRELLIERELPVEQVLILRLGRTEGDSYDEHVIGKRDLDNGYRIFTACLTIHQLRKEMD